MNIETVVRDFNKTFSVPKRKHPDEATPDDFRLMHDVVSEEVLELAAAIEVQDEEQIYDALIDIIYVTAQQADKLGFPVSKGIAEVHRSNMSKLGEDGSPIFRKDGKVLKGPNFTGPKLQNILDATTILNSLG